MEISFAARRLERDLTDPKRMRRRYGELTQRLKARLAVLEKARNLADVPHVPPERCHPLKEEYDGCFAVDLSGNWRLIFEPNHDPVPIREDGGVDLATITAVKIVVIDDYHGK